MPRYIPSTPSAMVSNPYPRMKETQPTHTQCEVCDRTILTKDWNAHKNSKKHRQTGEASKSKGSQIQETGGWQTEGDSAVPNDGFNSGGFDNSATDNNGWSGGFDNSTTDNNGWSSGFNNASTGVQKGNGGCYTCGSNDHIKRDCPSGGGGGGQLCYGCNQPGHRKAECPNGGGRSDNRACYNCQEIGHSKINCPNPQVFRCRECNEVGHRAGDCPQSSRAAGAGQECFNCYEIGHRSKDCPNERVVKCRNCDAIGHMGKECPAPKDWSRVKCSNCGEMGHTKFKCKQPVVEDAGGYSGNDAMEAVGGWNSAPTEVVGGWDSAEGGAEASFDGGPMQDAGTGSWADEAGGDNDNTESQWGTTTASVAW